MAHRSPVTAGIGFGIESCSLFLCGQLNPHVALVGSCHDLDTTDSTL